MTIPARQLTSLPQLSSLAKQIFPKLNGSELFALYGNLGAGKTHFVRQLAKLLKIKTRVKSPTFSLINIHRGQLKSGKKITVIHTDLYRLKSPAEISTLGLQEFWNKKNIITFIEWPEKLKSRLPKTAIKIYFANAVQISHKKK